MVYENKKYKLGSVEGRTEYAMDFFTSRGFTREAAAGIVGNLLAESGINPKSEQYGGGPGRGIAQWSVDQRWQTYLKFAKNRGLEPTDLNAQLRFIIHEMPSQMGESAKTIKTMTDSNAAAKLFMDKYERPGKPNWDRRVSETARALRISTTKGAVRNDRGPSTRADDAKVKPKIDKTFIDEAKTFFDNLVPDTIQNAGEDAVMKARDFFNNLVPSPKDTTTKESTVLSVDRKTLNAL
jgi:hypothetical protein